MYRNPALWRGFQNIDCGFGSGCFWRLDPDLQTLYWILSDTEDFRTTVPETTDPIKRPVTWTNPA
jgi:hypothetical protein